MADLEAEKALAANYAVDEIEEGMLVGLGTGSTAAYAIREIGRRVAAGLKISVVGTSSASEALAREVRLAPLSFDQIDRVDLTIDGADEVSRSLQAIKGGGGALLREKIVASASDRVIAIVDSSKPVAVLGKFKLPLEVLPFAQAWAVRAVSRLGATATIRLKDGVPVRTDQQNLILDADFRAISDPVTVATALDSIPGIIEHGLFLTEIDTLVVGRGDRVEVLHR